MRHTVAVFILALAALPHAAHAAPAPPQGDQPGTADIANQVRAMVASNATMAGAVSVCRMDTAVVIKRCTELVVRNLVAPLPHPDDLIKETEAIWKHNSVAAHKLQMSADAPMTCPQVMRAASKAPLWKMCAPDTPPDQGSAGQHGGLRIQ